MSQPFRYYMQVRYSECDAQKAVFNARFADYVDLATTEFLHHAFEKEGLPDGCFDYQVVKLTIEWKAPAAYRDQLEIRVQPEKIGNTSFTLNLDFYNIQTNQFLARGELIGVAVDPATVEKMPISDAMRNAFNSGGLNGIVDHAGLNLMPTA